MDTPIEIDPNKISVEGHTYHNVDAPELWDAFVAGFMASWEGGNAEYPHAHDEESIRKAKREEFVEWMDDYVSDA